MTTPTLSLTSRHSFINPKKTFGGEICLLKFSVSLDWGVYNLFFLVT